MMISRLNQMFDALHQQQKMRLAAAYANDSHTIEACYHAVQKGIVDAILIGDKETILKTCNELSIPSTVFTIIHEPIDSKAAARAVKMILDGEAEILMKGLISTEKYMKAILNKEQGLMSPKAILSHVTVIENPAYHKLMIVGDVAVIPAPELHEKVAITNYLIETAHALGIAKPKVAIIGAAETVSLKMPSSVDAAILAKMADRGQIKGAIVDGPLALDLAIDQESAQIKGINSPVAGDADCLLFPNIESGNVFYKTNSKLTQSNMAAIVAGALAPCILSSRGDSSETKLYSIALAALIAAYKK